MEKKKKKKYGYKMKKKKKKKKGLVLIKEIKEATKSRLWKIQSLLERYSDAWWPFNCIF